MNLLIFPGKVMNTNINSNYGNTLMSLAQMTVITGKQRTATYGQIKGNCK
jgi:hypothetical protein